MPQNTSKSTSLHLRASELNVSDMVPVSRVSAGGEDRSTRIAPTALNTN